MRSSCRILFLFVSLFPPSVVFGQARPGDCGYDRWPVKIMRDGDANRVQRSPVSTTINELARIPIPEIPYPRDRRIAPQELTVYRIRGIIEHIAVEDDRDWHIIIRDPDQPSASMIVEIPDPQCVEDSALKARLVEARRALHSVPRLGLAEVEGVGFFDFIHTQRGAAKNGFELHPVLSIRSIPTQ
jgi:hypothetical protein